MSWSGDVVVGPPRHRSCPKRYMSKDAGATGCVTSAFAFAFAFALVAGRSCTRAQAAGHDLDGHGVLSGWTRLPGGAALLVVIAQYQVQPGRGDQVASVLARHAAASLAETGCLAFDVERSLADRDHFVLHEEYTDEDAFQAHRESTHFRANIEQVVAPLLTERKAERYERVEPSAS
jgi:quinol monooxygenase YgiN